MPRRARPPRLPRTWSRGRLIAVLLGSCIVVAALAVGLAASLYLSLTPSRDGGAGPTSDRARGIVDQPWPSVPPDAWMPSELSADTFETIEMPAATALGPADVATGFPRTPEGAVAQLAAIDQATLQRATVLEAQRIIAAWAMPGGPTPATWSGVKGVAQLLGSAGLPDSGSDGLLVTVTPAMGIIRGAIGADFVVVCVDHVVEVALNQTARAAVADCQQMVWNHTRWMIGPGAEPEPAPSVWPGTATAKKVGYARLIPAPTTGGER